jgi:hypothetical protein
MKKENLRAMKTQLFDKQVPKFEKIGRRRKMCWIK